MKIFAVRDEDNTTNKAVAYLFYYEKEKRFYIELLEEANSWETPLILSSFLKKGQKTISAYWSRIWVQQRIVPSDRQNLGMILRDNGLDFYDEYKLLTMTNGRCSQDSYYLEPISEKDLPKEFVKRNQQKVEDVTAYSIKRIVNDIVSKARQGIKIRLSTDNRSKEATELVLALSQYRRSLSIADDSRKLLSANAQQISYAEEDLNAALGGIKCFFASKAKKAKAVEVFNLLFSLKDSEYGRNADVQFDIADKIERAQGSDAWQDFSNNSVRFFNDLEGINSGVLGNDDSMYGLPEDLAREI